MKTTQPRICWSPQAVWVLCGSLDFVEHSFCETPWNMQCSNGTEINNSIPAAFMVLHFCYKWISTVHIMWNDICGCVQCSSGVGVEQTQLHTLEPSAPNGVHDIPWKESRSRPGRPSTFLSTRSFTDCCSSVSGGVCGPGVVFNGLGGQC